MQRHHFHNFLQTMRGQFLLAAAVGFLVGLSIALAVNSFAQVWTSVTVGSRHFDRGADFNERNLGIGVEVVKSENGRLVGGVYRNSIDRTSAYAGYTWAPEILPGARLGMVGGVVTGYRLSPAPMLAPVLMLEGKHVGANVILVPSVGKDVPGMVGLQVKVRLE